MASDLCAKGPETFHASVKEFLKMAKSKKDLPTESQGLIMEILNNGFKMKVFAFLILCVLVFGVFSNALKNKFTTWDDISVYTDSLIRTPSWENAKKIFTFHRGSTYQPVRRISFMLDYFFCKRNPFCYHFFNVLYYFFTVYFLFLFTEKLLYFLSSWDQGKRHLIALFSTIIFAVHPVHVEAVAWISARKEVLLGWFFFASLYFYLRGREGGKNSFRMFFLAFLFFVLSVLSKPSAVVMPAVLLLFEVCYRPKEVKKLLAFIVPSVIVAGIAVFILMTVMKQAGGIKPYRGGTFWTNFLVAFFIFINYMKLCAATINFSAAYTIWLPSNPMSIWTFLAVAFNLFILWIGIRSYKRSPVITFVILWFYLQLLPYSNIIPISTILADRYALLASFSYTLLVGVAFTWFMYLRHEKFTKEFFKVLGLAIFILLTAGYSYITIKQNRVWHDTRTLWMDAYEKYPHAPASQHGAALVFMKMGAYETARNILKETIQIQPYDYLAHNNLGICYFRLKDYKNALKEYKEALYYDPNNVKAKINLAMLYTAMEQYEKAEKVYQELLRLNPRNSNWHFRAAYNYNQWGHYEKAIEELKKSIKLTPHVLNPYEVMAMIYYEKLHQRRKAIVILETGLKNAPNSPIRNRVEKRLKEIKKVVSGE